MRYLSYLFLCVCIPVSLSAAPKSDLWLKWVTHDEQSTLTIDHQLWDSFLANNLNFTHTSGIHLVRYQKVSSNDRQQLQSYLQMLQSLPISKYSRTEQMAYWINLYNARTMELILEHYPVASIKDISFGWFSFGPWDEKILKVEGEELTLNDVEHRILRPIWQDARIHYVVNCASMSCPNLAKVAFTAKNTPKLLDRMARSYVNHPRGVVFINGALQLSKIYDWYQEDFGNSEAEVIQHLLQYAEKSLADRLQRYADDIEYEYDWSLNQ